MDVNGHNIRKEFPVLGREVYGKRFVYFDNAATSQKPTGVLELHDRIYRESNANIHRAVHRLSAEATDLYEKGRSAVAEFINAQPDGCVIITSGATASFNLLAHSFVQRFVGNGDKILVSEAEHHSNLVPWQLACERVGAELVAIPIEESGEISLDKFESLLDSRVKLVSVAQVSNVLGIVNPIKEMVALAHAKGIPVAVDGAQGVVHSDCDVAELGCDFYIFSGHKIYAPAGTGILYGKRALLEEMPPFFGGGDMVGTVTFEKTTYAPLPLKFEAGTPNFPAAACYAPALEFADAVRKNAALRAEERCIMMFLVERLLKIDGLHIAGLPKDMEKKVPVISFSVEGAHPEDMALILDKMGIAVRSGLMCAEPLVRKYSENGLLRISLLPYNTMDEAEYFLECLDRTLKMLG
ncbi:MAG: SufS family cysteine desulfurase [Bacteroidales bacterium]|nr:SufS family cysteine desulfurase [Bacteroidales bacterium]